jgi:hypothetical protein
VVAVLSVVKGSFQVLGSEPDGDSVHFVPDDPHAFRALHIPARLGPGGRVQLRLDAIDALETHYTPPGHGQGTRHQPLDLAHAAADLLLAQLGFSGLARSANGETITATTPPRTRGHLLTRSADKHGRPISLVVPGDTDRADLSGVFVDADLLRTTINHRLVETGLAYPTYYSQLYPDLRVAFTAATAQARAGKLGVWAADATTSGATIAAGTDLSDRLVVLPKLFRRLTDYLALGAGSLDLGGFRDFLVARDDRLFVLSDGQLTGLDTIVTVDGPTVAMTRPPEDLLFFEA